MDHGAGGNYWLNTLFNEELHNSSKHDEENVQELDISGSFMYPRRAQNHPGVSSEVILNETSGSKVQVSQSSNISSARALRKCVSSLSERAARKREIDREYRKRVKNSNLQMKLDLENLTGENGALKIENQSLKDDNASMKQVMTNQGKNIDQLRSDHFQLRRKYDKIYALVDTLSKRLADPSRLENEKLKNENAWLRKNVNLNSNVPQLLEENVKLKKKNRVLKVQNDALCAKMISDNEK